MDICSVLEEQKGRKLIIIVAVITGLVATSLCIFGSWLWRTKKIKRKSKEAVSAAYEKKGPYPSDSAEIVLRDDVDEVSLDEFPLHSFEMLANATDQFNEANLLGRGGFGPVYKVSSFCFLIFYPLYNIVSNCNACLFMYRGSWQVGRKLL